MTEPLPAQSSVSPVNMAAVTMPMPRSRAFSTPAPGERRIVPTATADGNRNRSRSMIWRRSGMIMTTPRSEPATPASTTALQFVLSLRRAPFRSNRKRTGIVKMIPEFTVFTDEAIVWKMFTSRIDPLRMIPRSTPKPTIAPTVEPTIVNPI